MTAEGKPSLGPVQTDVRHAQQVLDGLWDQTGVETRAYTGNIVALTVQRHLERVQEALSSLEGRYAGRQLIGVMDGDETVGVEVSLVPQRSLYIERLTLDANPEQLQGAILPLLRPATVNHVWWASEDAPTGKLLNELADLADQVIGDTLTLQIPPDSRYALADLGWARSATWREAVAQLFDSPDAARELPHIKRLEVEYAAPGSELPARLFAAWIAAHLGWQDLGRVKLQAHPDSPRQKGDLSRVALTGEGITFEVAASQGESAHWVSDFGGNRFEGDIIVPFMTLGEGLERVMARPDRAADFEAALKLARQDQGER